MPTRNGKLPLAPDKVYQESRIEEGKQPNGKVVWVDFNEEWEAKVVFYDVPKYTVEFISLDVFTNTWTDRFGGTWMI